MEKVCLISVVSKKTEHEHNVSFHYGCMLKDKWDNIFLLLLLLLLLLLYYYYYYYYYYYFMYTCLLSPLSKFVSINNTFIQFFCDKHEVTTVYQP